MKPEDVVGNGRWQRLRFHDGSERMVCATDIETPFPSGELIVSQTDVGGVITRCNDAFVRMSGYRSDELLGAPHHILRHPDMPRVAFQGLWDTLAKGVKWHGYVKNLRKDGGFYWVFATVVPNLRRGELVGYSSVRREPPRPKVLELADLYSRWLLEETATKDPAGTST
jgi:aerotaxis receptor